MDQTVEVIFHAGNEGLIAFLLCTALFAAICGLLWQPAKKTRR